MIDVCLLGTGGTMPLPERALTSLCVRYSGSSFLVDCGEGTQVQLRKAGLSMHDIDAILVTHCHADHISGLPGLLLSMAKSDRREPVVITAPPGAAAVIRSVCVICANLPFDVSIREMTGAHSEFELKGLHITAQSADHSVVCLAYSFEVRRRGRFDPQKARALGVDVNLWSVLQRGETVSAGGRPIAPDMVMGAPRKGLKVTYITDTRPTPELRALAEGSDLLICEGMYAEESKAKMAREKKHMTFSEAAMLAREARAARLWLTHFSPSLDDPYRFTDRLQEMFECSLIPHDLEKTELLFRKE